MELSDKRKVTAQTGGNGVDVTTEYNRHIGNNLDILDCGDEEARNDIKQLEKEWPSTLPVLRAIWSGDVTGVSYWLDSAIADIEAQVDGMVAKYNQRRDPVTRTMKLAEQAFAGGYRDNWLELASMLNVPPDTDNWDKYMTMYVTHIGTLKLRAMGNYGHPAGFPLASRFPTVMEYIRSQRKIQAIKEYRDKCPVPAFHTNPDGSVKEHVGLLEAKNAVDAAEKMIKAGVL